MFMIPLNLFALPSFVGVLILDVWLLSACVWIVLRRFSLSWNCDPFMRSFVESPVLRARSLIERKLNISVPKMSVWMVLLFAVLIVRQILVGIIVTSCQFNGTH